MYIIMRKKSATDFGLHNAATLDRISSEEMQLHHIFPFDFMMKDDKASEYCKRAGFNRSEYREHINDIANITFISQGKNASIGNIAPWQYLENETTKQIRSAHFIPENHNLWKPENYDEFLEQRRRMLAKAINSLIKSLN